MNEAMENIYKEFEKLRRGYQSKIQNIQEDPDITREAKKGKIKQLVSEAGDKRQELLKKLESTRRSEKARIEKEIFSPPISVLANQGEKAAIRAIYNQALNAAAKMHEDELIEMLNCSVRSGDSYGVIAVGNVAYDKGFRKAFDSFAKTDGVPKEELKALQEFNSNYGDARDNSLKFAERIKTSGPSMPQDI